MLNKSDWVAAAAVRLLATARNAFAVAPADIVARLTHPALLGMLGDMLGRDSANAARLTDDELTELVRTCALEAAATEHPWLLAHVQDRVVLHPCTAYTNLQSIVQSTLYTFSLGQPALHACVVRTAEHVVSGAVEPPLHGNAAVCILSGE